MNKKTLFAYLLAFLCLTSCTSTEHKAKVDKVSEEGAHKNRLAYENSPYLLQHASNPVEWYPWGEEALKKAQSLKKPIIISIGYAACHWCHVMENESFEDEEVAAYMNENFINIKVDREERPDIDQVYMDAAQMLTGSGGWPLNVIALPDGRPFFAGTYFNKEGWQKMLQRISNLYQDERPKLESIAEQLTKGIQEIDMAGVKMVDQQAFVRENATEAYKDWKKLFDTEHGGYQRSPKFPMPASYQSLLTYYHFSQDVEVLTHIKKTLDELLQGGIYDQVGGGFARYATDKEWKVPHFEKMLYDNAQLVSLYAQAYQVTKKADYRRVVEESLAFIEREMRHKQGGFYSSLDADSEGKEGQFYTWSIAEIKLLLGEDASIFADFFQLKEEGNWEGEGNILIAKGNTKELAQLLKSSETEALGRLKAWKKVLLKARNKRIHPSTDDKSLTAWNSLMISAYVDASQALQEPKYLKTALDAAKFLKERMMGTDYSLRRNYKDGRAGIGGFLDDYAFTIQAFMDLYEATFDAAWLSDAKGLLSYAQKHFYDTKTGYFFYASDLDFKLIVRKTELTDNVIPSSNAIMAKNLFLLGHYFSDADYWEESRRMLSGMQELMQEEPSFYANWWQLYLYEAYPFYEVAVVGNDAGRLSGEFGKHFLPHKILLGGKTEAGLSFLEGKLKTGQTTIYVCQEGSCKKPVTAINEAMGQLKVR